MSPEKMGEPEAAIGLLVESNEGGLTVQARVTMKYRGKIRFKIGLFYSVRFVVV